MDDLETATLLRALSETNAKMAASRRDLRVSLRTLLDALASAEAGLQRLALFVAGDPLQRAREELRLVDDRHRNDGPEDRRRRRLPPWLIYPVIIVSALFDAAFVGTIVQRFMRSGPDELNYWLAYLPGVGLALVLLVAGTALAEHAFRHQDRVTRSTSRGRLNPLIVLRRCWAWRDQPDTRNRDDLPWPRLLVAVVGTVTVLGLLSLFAWIRAVVSISENSRLGGLWPAFVIIVVLLSVSAVAVKVLSRNPYADSASEARRRVRRTDKEAHRLSDGARTAVNRYAEEFHRHHGEIAVAEDAAQRITWDACTTVLEQRGNRGARGTATFPFIGRPGPVAADPEQPIGGGFLILPTLDDEVSGLELPKPRDLERRLAGLLARLDDQAGWRERPALEAPLR